MALPASSPNPRDVHRRDCPNRGKKGHVDKDCKHPPWQKALWPVLIAWDGRHCAAAPTVCNGRGADVVGSIHALASRWTAGGHKEKRP